jgi:hypothetical protein
VHSPHQDNAAGGWMRRITMEKKQAADAAGEPVEA